MSQLFTTGSGQTVIAGAELGRGGEGTVLEVRGDPTRCIKLYSGQTAATALGKLSVMIARPPLDPTLGTSRHHSIAWPEQLLFKAPGQTVFAGFLMPRVDGKVFRTALSYLSPESRVKDLGGAFNWKYLYTAATNIASSVGALHEKGYCIGDLNESNLLIAPNALITIIDCDSFQVPDPATGTIYRCRVGKPEYTAPELQGRYGEIDRTLATDRFALGVLLFQLLMEGTHPYQARGEAVEDLPSSQQKISKGLFPYARGVRGVSPPAFAPPFDVLDPSLRKLFLRCFEEGHGDPAARPSAQEWYDTLRNRESLLLTCPVNANHIYFSHLKQCPWCERAQAMRRDSFPNSLGAQIALADSKAPLPSLETRLGHLRGLIALALADGVITSKEREYLINRGLETQLTKKQVETVLEEEIRKTGAKRSAAGAPKLVLSTARLDFKEVQAGATVSHSITLSNQGSGVLTGSLHSTRGWLSCPGAIDPNRHVQTLPVTVNAKDLPPGFTGTGQITVRSNGGEATLTVNLAVDLRKSALRKLRLSLVMGSTLVGFILGLPAGFLTEARTLAQASAWLAGLCLTGAGFTVSRKAGLAGLLWSLLLVLGIQINFVERPFSTAAAWAVLFGSAAWMMGPASYKVRARGAVLPYPALVTCAFLAATTLGVAYYSAIQTRILDLPERPAPAPPQSPRAAVPTSPPVATRSTPPLPFKDDGACLSKACTYRSWWAASRRTVVRKKPEAKAAVVFTLKPGEKAWAETGFVLTQRAGEAFVMGKVSLGDWQIRMGERVYLLHEAGEERYHVWYQGYDLDVESAKLAAFEKPRAVWWVKLTNAKGLTGWVNGTEAFAPKSELDEE